MRKTVVFICTIIISICTVYVGGCSKTSKSAKTEYNIECTLDGYALSATQNVCFINNTENVIEELKFNLFANAFRKNAKFSPISAQYLSRAYPNGMSYGDMKISQVEVDGKSANYQVCGQDENILQVNLEKQIFPDEKVIVMIKFTVN